MPGHYSLRDRAHKLILCHEHNAVFPVLTAEMFSMAYAQDGMVFCRTCQIITTLVVTVNISIFIARLAMISLRIPSRAALSQCALSALMTYLK